MGELTAVDLFVGHIGAIVVAVAEFDAGDALRSAGGRSLRAEEHAVRTAVGRAVLLVGQVGAVGVAIAAPARRNAQPVVAAELLAVARREA